MVLFLSGGGSGEDSKELDTEFLNVINKSQPILYIPLARELPYDSCLDWIKSNFEPFEFDNFEMIQNSEELKNKNLGDYSAIYIGGGNTYKLLNDLRTSGFLEKLKAYVASGGVVYGGSAGAIIWGKDISTANDPNEINLLELNGIGRVGKFSISCHYFDKDEESVKDYVKKTKIPVIALPEKSGIVIEGNEAKVVGKESIKTFGETSKKSISSGEKFSLT